MAAQAHLKLGEVSSESGTNKMSEGEEDAVRSHVVMMNQLQ